MRRRLVELLRCPVCRQVLLLRALEEQQEHEAPAVPGVCCASYCALHDLRLAGDDAAELDIDCRACYGREVVEGFLECRDCHLLYPVIEGVPRLISDAFDRYGDFFHRYRDRIAEIDGQEELSHRLAQLDASVFDRRSNESFSLQWQVYQYEDKTWFKQLELRHQEFLYSMDLAAEELDGSLVLDAGCGNGRLTASVARYGAEIVGMDLSRSVVKANENRHTFAGDRAPFVHFLQGNIMQPPLAEAAFDHIHTSGVLHHTPDPRRALDSFVTTVRAGGRTYVQLYRKREAWVALPNYLLRLVTRRMPVALLFRLCYLMVPVHTALVLLVAKLRGETSPIREANRRERAVSLFDHLSPRYQFRYRPERARRMLEEAGLRNVRDVTLANEARHMVAFVGER
jgi:2-polyprenyl-3-methyl-5-hydroxy-6-metoxy-1,4-benzoquinol methylase/uncharacterized protein YbaR (Trm112 family)